MGHRFVEDEHGGTAGKGPRDGQSISLAVRQLFGRLFRMIVEIEVGQPVKGRPGCAVLHLFEMGAGRAVRPQAVILRNPKQRQAAIVAVDEGFDAAAIGAGEAAQQVEQRRFAGSGDAQDGRDATGNVEIRNVEPRAGPALDANVFQMPQSIAHVRRRAPGFAAVPKFAPAPFWFVQRQFIAAPSVRRIVVRPPEGQWPRAGGGSTPRSSQTVDRPAGSA